MSSFSYQRWIGTFASFCLLFLFCVAAFNYRIDSAGLFKKDTVIQAAFALSQGKSIVGLENFDERLFQKEIIRNLPRVPDIIVLGSSRSKQIRGTEFGNTFMYNHGVSAGGLGDMIGILGAYEQMRGTLPKGVLIGVDHWILDKNTHYGRIGAATATFLKEYQDYELRKIHGGKEDTAFSNIFSTPWIQLINFDYTRTNLKRLFESNGNRESKIHTVSDLSSDKLLISGKDGSVYYPLSERKLPQEEVEKRAIINGGDHEAGPHFSSGYDKIFFEKMIVYLLSRGVSPVLYLVPHHPTTYRLHIEYSDDLVRIELYVRDFAARVHIPVVGSYNPVAYHLSGEDFFDGDHGKDTVSRKVFSQDAPKGIVSLFPAIAPHDSSQ